MNDNVKLVEEIAEDFGSRAESNALDNAVPSTAWIGWLAVGLRKTMGGLENDDKEVDEPSLIQRSTNWFLGASQNSAIAAETLQLGEKDHSKSSQFDSSKDVDCEATKVDQSETVSSEPTRRRRVLKRQPTGDEAAFDIDAAKATSSGTTRRGRKTRGVASQSGGTFADESGVTAADESHGQEDSTSAGGATTSESSTGSRCKPLLERKPTGDEDTWESVSPEPTRRGRRKQNNGVQNDEMESKESGPRSRPVVRRQPTGDSDTFAGFEKQRVGARRGRKTLVKEEVSEETATEGNAKQAPPNPERPSRKVVERTPTGDFSEGDPMPPQQTSLGESKQEPRRSRPVVRRQQTGDESDFAAIIAPAPRRGRRNRDPSENEDSQTHEDSTDSQPKTRRSRPVARRQATGDASDFMAAGFTSPPSRPKRRTRRAEDQSDSNVDSEGNCDMSGGSDALDSNNNSMASDASNNADGDLNETPKLSSSPDRSSKRKGRRRESASSSHCENSSSGGSASHLITRAGLVRQVTGDGTSLMPLGPSRCARREVSAASSVTMSDNLLSIARTEQDEQQNKETSTLENDSKSADSEGPRRGVRRQPTGDLDDFFLKESPLQLADQFLKAPQRWAGNSPRNSPQSVSTNSNKADGEVLRGVKRTPTGDEADFAMLIAMDSDGEESTESPVQGFETKDRDQPLRGVKRTPTGDGLEFALDLDDEIDKTDNDAEESANESSSVVQNAKGDQHNKEVSRGVKRTPTGDDLNFAMSLEDDDSETTGEEADTSGQTMETFVSTVNGKNDAPTIQRGTVQRTPTGDEAEFALMLGIVSDEEVDDADEQNQTENVESASSTVPRT